MSASQPAGKTASPAGKLLSWIIVLGLLATAGWFFRKNFMDPATQANASTSSASGKNGHGGGAVPVVVSSVTRGDMPVFLRGLGSVTAFNTVTIRSRVDGQLVKVAFQEGQFVKEGDLLAEIDPRPFQVQLAQAEGQLAKDVAQQKDAETIYQRDVALYKEEVIAKAQVDTQAAQVGLYEGSIASDRAMIENAKLQLVYCKILAPISGRVGLRLVDLGNIIHATDTNGMLVITQMQPIAVIFSLPQDSLPDVYRRLRAGEQLNVEAFDRDNSTKISAGKLLTIDNQIDSNTGTYKLKAVFDNENNGLFPNQFVNIRLLVDTRHGLTIAPAAAVQRGPKGSYVYAVEDKKVHVRPVTVAITEGDSVGISDGLAPGAVVVTDGQDKLQDGSTIDTEDIGSGPASGSGKKRDKPE